MRGTIICPALDASDRLRVPYFLGVNDIIEWKNRDRRGIQRARVTAINPNGTERPIRIIPMNTGNDTERWISMRNVIHIYHSDGTRKTPISNIEVRTSC